MTKNFPGQTRFTCFERIIGFIFQLRRIIGFVLRRIIRIFQPPFFFRLRKRIRRSGGHRPAGGQSGQSGAGGSRIRCGSSGPASVSATGQSGIAGRSTGRCCRSGQTGTGRTGVSGRTGRSGRRSGSGRPRRSGQLSRSWRMLTTLDCYLLENRSRQPHNRSNRVRCRPFNKPRPCPTLPAPPALTPHRPRELHLSLSLSCRFEFQMHWPMIYPKSSPKKMEKSHFPANLKFKFLRAPKNVRQFEIC